MQSEIFLSNQVYRKTSFLIDIFLAFKIDCEKE